MGRQIRSTLPILIKSLMPKWSDLNEFCKVDQQFKQKQKKNYDKRHRTSELPTFEEDEPVFVATDRDSVPVPGRIVRSTGNRLYEIQTPSVVVRRNRSYIHSRPEEASTSETDPEPNSSCRSLVITRSRSGTVTIYSLQTD